MPEERKAELTAIAMDNALRSWRETSLLRGLHEKAKVQIGTSGGGNHFAEIVVGEWIGSQGAFVGLLTHSGSRGVGHAIATHYAKLAEKETAKLASVPRTYEWLALDSQAGQEYYHAMQLAGDFAQANHEVIHARFAEALSTKPYMTVQNHHNFAWLHGDEVIHRKGATPAEAGVMGIIPGSMGTSSYLVRGLGNEESLHSASHGAGRVGSRAKAKATIDPEAVKRLLAEKDVLVRGLSLDEAPQAYKDIEQVIQYQLDAGLIETTARMRPIAVIMSGSKGED
jgi:tRNA-splicing ligase RtcB